MISLLIRSAQRTSDPDGRSSATDILIRDGWIAAISADSPLPSVPGVPELDARHCAVSTGFFDLHVHLREPGQSHKETITTGTRAAARGGFTRIACMPNTRPVLDDPDTLRMLSARLSEEAVISVDVIAAVTHGSQGEALTDFAALARAGAMALSDDGRGIQRASVMRLALAEAAKVGLPIFAHCEDESLSQKGVIHEGVTAHDRCLIGIPSESEAVHVARDIVLAEQSGAHYHVCHLSSAQSLQLVRDAKHRGLRVTCEVTPHHLLLCDHDIVGDDGNFKMNPPLRTKADREALVAGLSDGSIDVIATDHAPHTVSEKSRGLLHAPFGVIGLETAFPLLYTELVLRGQLTLSRLLDLLALRPYTLMNRKPPQLAVGQPADLVLLDLQTARPVTASELRSRSSNTPFFHRMLRGWPVLTLASGRVAYSGLDTVAEMPLSASTADTV